MITQGSDDGLLSLFSASVVDLFRDALRISLRNPAQAAFLMRTIRWQRQAAARRSAWQSQGVHVPPFMICSVTNRCNLNCAGCYNRAQNRDTSGEMSEGKLREILTESRELGISIALLAGGEPLVRDDLLRVTADFPEIVFPVFTNGLLIDQVVLATLRRQRNVVPVVSVEGHAGDTDVRRGAGMGERLGAITARLRDEELFYGLSLTVRRQTLDAVLCNEFAEDHIQRGCKLFFFVEYVPVEQGTEDWVLTQEQRERLMRATAAMRERLPAIFIAFPGDEEAMGGCLAAGRGFIHVSAKGDVEPCPFAPYSDASLKDMSIRQALDSPLLKAIREASAELHDTSGGCALWNKRAWVEAKMAEQQDGSSARS